MYVQSIFRKTDQAPAARFVHNLNRTELMTSVKQKDLTKSFFSLVLLSLKFPLWGKKNTHEPNNLQS